MNKDERQRCMLINCVIRLFVTLGNPFSCGLCYALVEQEWPWGQLNLNRNEYQVYFLGVEVASA